MKVNRPIRRPTVCKVFRVAVEDIGPDTGPIRERFHPEAVASPPFQLASQRKPCSPSRSWCWSRSSSSWSPAEGPSPTVDDAHGESSAGGRAIVASVDLSRRGPPWWPGSGQPRLRIPPNRPRDNPSPISCCRTPPALQNYHTKLSSIWLLIFVTPFNCNERSGKEGELASRVPRIRHPARDRTGSVGIVYTPV